MWSLPPSCYHQYLSGLAAILSNSKVLKALAITKILHYYVQRILLS